MLQSSLFFKIRVTVPVSAADAVREAMGLTGAGVQGNYAHCSFSYRGTGRFVPLPGANPAIGEVGQVEEVEEEMIEMLCYKDRIKEVITALKKVHPYEEPAIDIMERFDIE